MSVRLLADGVDLVKHWHGATATSGMTHIAISEALDGKTVDRLEHVSDEQHKR